MDVFRLLAFVLAVVACSTSNGSNDVGSTPPKDPPTMPAKGTVDGFPFSVVGSYAFSPSCCPKSISIELTSYYDDCSQKAFPPDKGTAIGIEIPRTMLAVGRYEVTAPSYAVDPGGVAMSAGAYPRDDAGLPTTWIADLMGAGVVWLTSVTPTQITGAFWVNAPRLNTSAAGTFTAPVCGAGADAAADAPKD